MELVVVVEFSERATGLVVVGEDLAAIIVVDETVVEELVVVILVAVTLAAPCVALATIAAVLLDWALLLVIVELVETAMLFDVEAVATLVVKELSPGATIPLVVEEELATEVAAELALEKAVVEITAAEVVFLVVVGSPVGTSAELLVTEFAGATVVELAETAPLVAFVFVPEIVLEIAVVEFVDEEDTGATGAKVEIVILFVVLPRSVVALARIVVLLRLVEIVVVVDEMNGIVVVKNVELAIDVVLRTTGLAIAVVELLEPSSLFRSVVVLLTSEETTAVAVSEVSEVIEELIIGIAELGTAERVFEPLRKAVELKKTLAVAELVLEADSVITRELLRGAIMVVANGAEVTGDVTLGGMELPVGEI